MLLRALIPLARVQEAPAPGLLKLTGRPMSFRTGQKNSGPKSMYSLLVFVLPDMSCVVARAFPMGICPRRHELAMPTGAIGRRQKPAPPLSDAHASNSGRTCLSSGSRLALVRCLWVPLTPPSPREGRGEGEWRARHFDSGSRRHAASLDTGARHQQADGVWWMRAPPRQQHLAAHACQTPAGGAARGRRTSPLAVAQAL